MLYAVGAWEVVIPIAASIAAILALLLSSSALVTAQRARSEYEARLWEQVAALTELREAGAAVEREQTSILLQVLESERLVVEIAERQLIANQRLLSAIGPHPEGLTLEQGRLSHDELKLAAAKKKAAYLRRRGVAAAAQLDALLKSQTEDLAFAHGAARKLGGVIAENERS